MFPNLLITWAGSQELISNQPTLKIGVCVGERGDWGKWETELN
jgi:hypothetical protein